LLEIDLLFFGTSVEHETAGLTFHPWKLHHAPDPKFVRDETGETGTQRAFGLESPLVGLPAPDFQLNLLDGSRFHLAEQSGRVVVLDFWATWCEPCVETMPAVDEVVRDYAGKDVELVAINLDEQLPQVEAMLERHELEMRVALDRDGVVASKYAVSAIPQTVVIDRDGRVSRLYVGGGAQLAAALRAVLDELVGR
jgi:thiol-disulfide isomerase/thioredoxin